MVGKMGCVASLLAPPLSAQMIGLRRYYFLSKWNIFDLVILLVACVDLILELAIPQSTSRFSPAVLRVVRILRILRIGRVLRLVKVRAYYCLCRDLGYAPVVWSYTFVVWPYTFVVWPYTFVVWPVLQCL